MKKAVLIVFVLISVQGYGQNKWQVERSVLSNDFWERAALKAGYFGNNLWNPGLNGGLEYLLRKKIKSKEKKKGLRTTTKEILLNGNVGFYWDPKSHVGFFTNYGLLWRKTNKKGKQTNIQFNPLGFHRSFLPETYEVSNDQVSKVTLPGRNYFAPSISLGFGKLRKDSKLTGRYINLNVMILTPSNTNITPLIFIEYGYRFNKKKKKSRS